MTKRHMFLMLACCLIPLAGLVAIYLFDLPINTVIYVGMILLCPLLHFVMMRSMMGHDQQQADHSHHMGGGERAPMAQKTRLITGEQEESLR